MPQADRSAALIQPSIMMLAKAVVGFIFRRDELGMDAEIISPGSGAASQSVQFGRQQNILFWIQKSDLGGLAVHAYGQLIQHQPDGLGVDSARYFGVAGVTLIAPGGDAVLFRVG